MIRELLSNPIWQGIAAILTLIALINSIILYWASRKKKKLNYEILTNSSVISVTSKASNVKDSIQILYNGNVVSNMQLQEIHFENTGDFPIEPEDYVEPITIEYPDTIKILSANIIDHQSLGMKIENEFSNQPKIVLSKTLLNEKDSFDIKMLLSGNANFSVFGRIVGVSKIQPDQRNKFFRDLYSLTFFLLELDAAFIVVFLLPWGLTKWLDLPNDMVLTFQALIFLLTVPPLFYFLSKKSQ